MFLFKTVQLDLPSSNLLLEARRRPGSSAFSRQRLSLAGSDSRGHGDALRGTVYLGARCIDKVPQFPEHIAKN